MTKATTSGQNDPESDFIRVFSGSPSDSTLTSTLDECRDLISKISTIPTSSTLLGFEIFTRHPFGSSVRDREAQPFCDALHSVFKFVVYLTLATEPKKFTDSVRASLFDDWENCSRCPQLQNILRAAFGIVAEDDELLDMAFQPRTIAFLADVALKQSLLCQFRFFQHILTAVGKVFVIIPVEKFLPRINTFRDNEKKADQDNEEGGDFQAFLRLVTNISMLRNGNDDFAYTLHRVGNNFIHYATDFVSKSMFATFINTLAALTKNKAIALEFYKRLNDSLSDIINLKHIVEVFNGYASDFQNSEVNHNKLDYHDANSLEAILHLLSAFFTYSEEIRSDITEDSKKAGDPKNYCFVDSLVNLLHSPIPASLKAACFDTLASLTIDPQKTVELWGKLEKCQILTAEFLKEGKGGIISDIDNIESEGKSYPLARSFISFLSALLKSQPPLNDFKIYHQFLFEQSLLRIRARVFSHFLEKWSLVSKLCQCWHYLSLHSFEHSKYLMETALCDSRFIREFIILVNEEDIPQESLLCIFRLFLDISCLEPSYSEKMDPKNRVFYTPIAKSFSYSSEALVKLVQCVSSNDRDLKLITLNFMQHIAKLPDGISQIVFSRPQAKAIQSFKRVININEDEGEERNVRNTLLELLISLGSSSYFVRYVCNFDMNDPPQSIFRSTLEKGILPIILQKMKETEAAKNYPLFAANSLKLLLMICDNPLTSKPLLNLLRSSRHSFFDEQLRLLQDVNSSLIAIGCFLQLLAREATDSMYDSYSGTTLQTFNILMGTEGFREHRKRLILFDEFLDRINDSDEAVVVACGIYETSMAYSSSTSTVKLMSDLAGNWINVWVQFLLHMFKKLCNLENTATINYLTQSISVIGMFLFGKKILGEVPFEEKKKVFVDSCKTLKALKDNMYSNLGKLGIYSLITSIDVSDLKEVFMDFEHKFIVDLTEDLKSEAPVLQAEVYATAEKIIDICEVNIMKNYFVSQIITLDDHNNYKILEQNGAALIISAKYSFLNHLLISRPKDFDQFLIDNHIIEIISKESFWNEIRERYYTSTQFSLSDTMLQVATRALNAMTALSIRASNDENLNKELLAFYLMYYEEQFLPVFHFPQFLSINALKFLFSLCCFLIFSPKEVSTKDEVLKSLKSLKTQFVDNSDKIKDRIRGNGNNLDESPSAETLREAESIISNFKRFLQ